MLDNSRKWRPEPDWANARLEGSSIELRAITGLPQRLVSGDLDRFLAEHGLGKDVGALGFATGARYAVRLARDRLLAVGIPVDDGWHDEGYAVTGVGSALRVFEARGDGIRDLLARATTMDFDNPGPCAALSFCGVTAVVYFHEDTQTLRIHADRGLAAYLWEWFECQPLLSAR